MGGQDQRVRGLIVIIALVHPSFVYVPLLTIRSSATWTFECLVHVLYPEKVIGIGLSRAAYADLANCGYIA